MNFNIGNSFNKEDREKLLKVLPQAIDISQCDREVFIELVSTKEEDTYAFADWPLKFWFKTPVIKLTTKLMEQDLNMIGLTLTHELIHCRQGFWTIFSQNFWYSITFNDNFPPFEIEAYNSVNLWYDYKKESK